MQEMGGKFPFEIEGRYWRKAKQNPRRTIKKKCNLALQKGNINMRKHHMKECALIQPLILNHSLVGHVIWSFPT